MRSTSLLSLLLDAKVQCRIHVHFGKARLEVKLAEARFLMIWRFRRTHAMPTIVAICCQEMPARSGLDAHSETRASQLS